MIGGWKILDKADVYINTLNLSKDEERFIHEFLNHIVNLENIDPDRLEHLLDDFAAKSRVLLKQHQRTKILNYVRKFYFGLGYLEDLIGIDGIEEIAIVGLGKPIYIYRDGWKSTNITITSRDYFIDLVNRLSMKSNRRITLKNPRLNASLENYRIHASIEPISNCEMTLRILRKNSFSYRDFLDRHVYPLELLGYFAMIMFTDSSVVVAGNTGSGKTSFLNALMGFVPYGDRIVIVEETPEINIPHPQQVRIVENLDLGISLRDLVYDTLRMRSDRTIVGEIRKPDEVIAFMDVVLSGQARGTYATFHAHSSKELVSRMMTYGVSKEDILSIDFVIMQKRILQEVDGRLVEVRKGVEVTYLPDNITLYRIDTGIDHQSFMKILEEKTWMESRVLQEKYNKILDFLRNNTGDYQTLFQRYQRDIYGYNI
ncbi:MAG: ATPase, T2SS/T4P/T4SS family [Candidatus Micrarchaeota archaeon]|nr:ATPase, T2SS/T4P/T4SS family [Candidatus Micrarchaeota archaeon]MCX8154360.1 ATPase, T2SS/T4P/T4SS family [Candidatus Micrarchaeota archaeon]